MWSTMNLEKVDELNDFQNLFYVLYKKVCFSTVHFLTFHVYTVPYVDRGWSLDPLPNFFCGARFYRGAVFV